MKGFSQDSRLPKCTVTPSIGIKNVSSRQVLLAFDQCDLEHSGV